MSKHFLTLAALTAASLSAQAAIDLNTGSLSYSQNFDALASTGTTNAITTLPAGWTFSESGGSANTTYAAGDGSSNTGNTYSFGTGTSTDRALGGVQSGNLIPTFGASFINQASSNIISLAIGYTGEQWRLGQASRTVADQLTFQYSTDATSLTTGTWTSVSSLNFIAPVMTGAARALDGNANSTVLTGSITGLTLAQGSTIWLRWTDFNASGSDDGLAVDNFNLTATLAPVPEPSTYALLLAGLGAIGLIARRRRGA